MKFTVAALALAGSAMAAGAGDTVNQVLTQIQSDLTEFDSAIKAYAGDTSGIMSASKKIESDTISGAQAISAGSELTLSDAVGITTNVQGLQKTLDGALADLQGIAPQLASSGQCSTILDNLSTQSKSAQSLQDAITSKAPAETKAVAQQLGGAIGASIDNTNQFFKKACAGAPSGGAGGAGGAVAGPKGHDDSHSGMSGMGGMGAGSAGGSQSPASPASPAGAGGSGSKTNKASKTTGAAKPAQYTGAASTLTAPFLGALAVAVFAL